jgi:hypothetical protein
LNGATATEIKMKYACLDIKAGKKEPRFIIAVKQLLGVLTDFLNTEKLIENGVEDTYSVVSDPKAVEARGDLYSPDWVEVSLVRNLPQNYKEIADIVAELADTVPDSYLYELLWFIEDPQKALEEMKTQKKEGIANNMAAMGYGAENVGSEDDPPPTEE